jgi:hypothetical protein
MQEKEYSNEFVKYVFSKEEKAEISSNMAQKYGELEQLEKDKKAVTSDFNSKIDSAKAQIGGAAIKLTNGYEMKSVKCEVDRDYDKKFIRWIRTDNGEIAKERAMTADELQRELFND